MAKGYKSDGTPLGIGNQRAKLPDGRLKNKNQCQYFQNI